MTYAEKLKNPLWQKRRLEILQRDGWKCRLCNDKETTLHVHHKKYNGEPWEANDNDLSTLCAYCHTFIESFKTERCSVIDGHVFQSNGYRRYVALCDDDVVCIKDVFENGTVILITEFSKYNFMAICKNLIKYDTNTDAKTNP